MFVLKGTLNLMFPVIWSSFFLTKKSLIFLCIILVSDDSNAQSLVQLVQYLHVTFLFSLSFGISLPFPDICKMLQ